MLQKWKGRIDDIGPGTRVTAFVNVRWNRISYILIPHIHINTTIYLKCFIICHLFPCRKTIRLICFRIRQRKEKCCLPISTTTDIMVTYKILLLIVCGAGVILLRCKLNIFVVIVFIPNLN